MNFNNVYIQKINGFIIFDYLTYSIHNILKNDYKCIITDTLKDITIHKKDALIIIPQFCYKFLNNIQKFNDIYIIVINTEAIYKNKVFNINVFDFIKKFSINKIHILDYSENNVDFIKKYDIYLKNECNILFLPWGYNSFIDKNIDNTKITKTIDILLVGWIQNNSTRLKIKNEFIKKNINNKFNIKFINNQKTNMEQNLDLFLSARIVINIFSYDDVKIFDFYRFTLLLANKIFFITDEFEICNILKNSNDYLITSKIDNFVDFVFDNLNTMTDEQRQFIARKNYNWYKNIYNFDVEFKKYIDSIN